jgi:hypothetical protein
MKESNSKPVKIMITESQLKTLIENVANVPLSEEVKKNSII